MLWSHVFSSSTVYPPPSPLHATYTHSHHFVAHPIHFICRCSRMHAWMAGACWHASRITHGQSYLIKCIWFYMHKAFRHPNEGLGGPEVRCACEINIYIYFPLNIHLRPKIELWRLCSCSAGCVFFTLFSIVFSLFIALVMLLLHPPQRVPN